MTRPRLLEILAATIALAVTGYTIAYVGERRARVLAVEGAHPLVHWGSEDRDATLRRVFAPAIRIDGHVFRTRLIDTAADAPEPSE